MTAAAIPAKCPKCKRVFLGKDAIRAPSLDNCCCAYCGTRLEPHPKHRDHLDAKARRAWGRVASGAIVRRKTGGAVGTVISLRREKDGSPCNVMVEWSDTGAKLYEPPDRLTILTAEQLAAIGITKTADVAARDLLSGSCPNCGVRVDDDEDSGPDALCDVCRLKAREKAAPPKRARKGKGSPGTVCNCEPKGTDTPCQHGPGCMCPCHPPRSAAAPTLPPVKVPANEVPTSPGPHDTLLSRLSDLPTKLVERAREDGYHTVADVLRDEAYLQISSPAKDHLCVRDCHQLASVVRRFVDASTAEHATDPRCAACDTTGRLRTEELPAALERLPGSRLVPVEDAPGHLLAMLGTHHARQMRGHVCIGCLAAQERELARRRKGKKKEAGAK